MPNHLAGENSPYLLQHSNNPVEWYPWGEAALERARREDKPIFLSIGYAACHWCHVMEHESFEDPALAALLNEHFVSIKVDREERPDLDGIYMQATTAMTGSGGWPMSVFLTPDLKPFFAGTYFPPVQRHNLPAFRDVLTSLAQAWREQRAEIDRVAGEVVESLRQQSVTGPAGALSEATLEAAEAALISSADREHGGWGGAPKFPQPMAIEFLLRRAAAGRASNPEGLAVALRTLDRMSRGGMYDVVGGGFCRYSTDHLWRVPHFEKMLYDNAQLSLAYLHAYLITREDRFRRVAVETLDFVRRELLDPAGGFYSSLDADSEGQEGTFYVWTDREIADALGEPQLQELMTAAYGITARGNWEGRTVLQRALDDSTLAARFGLDPAQITVRLKEAHSRLLKARQRRPRPATDNKVIAAWNGLMLQAFAQAARYLGSNAQDQSYRDVAMRTGDFLLTALRPQGTLRRIWRDGKAGEVVFLEDYASVILGLLDLSQVDFRPKWFAAASGLAAEMLQRFQDPQGGFFDTPEDAPNVLLRPKDTQDNATPSGNALATEALLRLAGLSGDGKYRELAEKALRIGLAVAGQHPTAFARWLSAADLALAGESQLALVYPQDANVAEFLQVLDTVYRPNLHIAASAYPVEPEAPPLLQDRPLLKGRPTAYLCQGFVCQQPVNTASELSKQL